MPIADVNLLDSCLVTHETKQAQEKLHEDAVRLSSGGGLVEVLCSRVVKLICIEGHMGNLANAKDQS